MRSIQAATLAGGSNNQDRYVMGDGFAVVLDGVTSVAGDRSHDPAYRARLAAGHGYDVEHRALLLALQADQARRRNRPGGYWIAGAEPEAAAHGITTVEDRSGVAALLLASDGVDPERHPEATTWRDLVGDAKRYGAARVLQDIHDAEAADPDGRRWPRSKRHDDKTLVVIDLQ